MEGRRGVAAASDTCGEARRPLALVGSVGPRSACPLTSTTLIFYVGDWFLATHAVFSCVAKGVGFIETFSHSIQNSYVQSIHFLWFCLSSNVWWLFATFSSLMLKFHVTVSLYGVSILWSLFHVFLWRVVPCIWWDQSVVTDTQGQRTLGISIDSSTLRPSSASETHVLTLVFMRDRLHCFAHLANPNPANWSFLCLLTPHNWPPHPFCWPFLDHCILCSNITVWISGGLGTRRSCSNFCRFQL